MRIVSSDYKRTVDIGTAEIWEAFVGTVKVLLVQEQDDIPFALQFLLTGRCDPNQCIESAREMNLVRDRLAQYPPSKIVYNINDLSFVPNWAKTISPVITSCASFFTTSDGKDLLFETVSILCYGGVTGHGIMVEQ